MVYPYPSGAAAAHMQAQNGQTPRELRDVCEKQQTFQNSPQTTASEPFDPAKLRLLLTALGHLLDGGACQRDRLRKAMDFILGIDPPKQEVAGNASPIGGGGISEEIGYLLKRIADVGAETDREICRLERVVG